jgi:hypothetical protein
VEDGTRLPTIKHILFAVVPPWKEKEFLLMKKKEMRIGLYVKYVKNFGAYIICQSVKDAKHWFYRIREFYLVYPLEQVPREIKVDMMRSEYIFMEGVKPETTVTVAERFIKRHLGIKL